MDVSSGPPDRMIRSEPMRTVFVLLAGVGCTGDPVALPTDPGETPPICPDGDCVADPDGDEARIGWAQVAVDPDGVAWVLWARTDGAFVTGLFLARSEAPGEPLSAPIAVPIVEPPNVGSTEKPSLAVDGSRIAIAYTGSGALRHGDAHVVYVQLASRDTLVFDEPLQVDSLVGGAPFTPADPSELVIEQARVAFAPSGELWAMWKRQVYGTSDWATWGRESTGFTPTELEPALSHRHDCSPPDFRFGFSGEPLFGLRSNIDGWLQTMAVITDGDGQATSVTQVSNDTWRYNTEVCPEDGPRLVELADGTLFTAWMAPSGIAWQLFSAWSTDGGASWTPPAEDHGGVELGEKWVAIAATADGPFWTTVEGLDGRTRALLRDAPGATPAEHWMVGGDGSDLSDVEVAHDGGRTAAVGIGDGRVIWLVDL